MLHASLNCVRNAPAAACRPPGPNTPPAAGRLATHQVQCGTEWPIIARSHVRRGDAVMETASGDPTNAAR
jgi:hypothetical protein